MSGDRPTAVRWVNALAGALVVAAFALLTCAGRSAAQEGGIAGSVRAATGETLARVQVFVPGTGFGTLTDDGGRYRLAAIPPGEHIVRTRVLGYRRAERVVSVSPGEVTTADFVLEVSAVALDGLVATITGERRRRELAADIPTIDAETVAQDTRASQITQILKGQSTGVVVRQSSGTVGTGADVRIRGTGSISKSVQPLYVIDGAIVDGEANATDPLSRTRTPPGATVDPLDTGGQDFTRLSDLNPDEIESIEVIKGPVASALWGARGNAGVILITTRKGAAGGARWSARADLGVNRQANGFVDPAGGRSFVKGRFPTMGWNPLSFGFETDTIYTQNLLEEFNPFRSALHQNYNVNVRGGAGTSTYFGSVQYLNENGTLPNNEQQRLNLRANFAVDPGDRVSLSFSNGYMRGEVSLPTNDDHGFGYMGAAVGLPWLKPLDAVTDPVTGETVDSCPLAIELSRSTGAPTGAFADSCPENNFLLGATLEDIETIVHQKKIERYTGSGTVTWNPLDRWTHRFTLGYDMVDDRHLNLFPVDPDLPFRRFSLGDLVRLHTTSRNLTLQGTTTYLQRLTSSLDLELVGGLQWYRQTVEGSGVQGQGFPPGSPSVTNAVTSQASDGFDEQKSIGLFAQGQLQWRSRAFVNGAVRWDDNSSQGRNLGVQTYPKLGASLVALEGQGLVNTLKLRAAWGRSGTLPGTNDALSLLTAGPVAIQGSDEAGVSPDVPGNEELEPEVGEEWEAGFDLGMLEDRIGLAFTYYDQKTENAIVRDDVAPSLGFPSPRFANIGRIDNRGFEIELDALAIAEEDVSLDLRFILSHNRNRIARLDEPINFGGGRQRHQEGLPFGSYVQPRVVTGEQGNPRVLECADTPGTWGPADEPGAKEDFCDPRDHDRWLGDPTPGWESSIQGTVRLFEYVQLYALFDFQFGHDLSNLTGSFFCSLGVGGMCLDRWEKGPGGGLTDRARMIGFAADNGTSAPWVLDAGWGKWRTAQVRFDMPPGVTRFFNLNRLSIQLIGENLASWTGYNGLDPEINFRGQDGAIRAEFLTLPPARRFIGTISVSF